MRIVFASDIHGSLSAMESVVNVCQRVCADRLCLTGDITGFFGITKIVEILNPVRKITSGVLGNCDNEHFFSMLGIPFDSDFGVLRAFDRNLFYTHGHIYNRNNLPPIMNPGDVLISGHTHIPMIDTSGEYIFLNPGSAANPRGGFSKSYMILDDGLISVFDFEGNLIISGNI